MLKTGSRASTPHCARVLACGLQPRPRERSITRFADESDNRLGHDEASDGDDLVDGDAGTEPSCT
jgi:hypothetical protein